MQQKQQKITLLLGLIFLCQLVDYIFSRTVLFEINQRLVFGLLGNNSVSIITLIVFLILFAYLAYRYIGQLTGIGSILVLSGIISNLLDRIFYGGVMDYIQILMIPIFNIADLLIIIGIIIISYQLIFVGNKNIQP